MNQINCKCGRTILPAKTRVNVTCQCGCRYSKVNGGWVMMYDSYPRVSKKILPILLIGLLFISPSVAFAQDNGTPPLPIEQTADQLQAAADAALANAQAAVTAAQQAAQQAAAAKAQAAAARERANALDAQAALSRASEAERLAESASAQAQAALSAAREALAHAARAVTALKEAQASARSARVSAAQASAVAQANHAAAVDQAEQRAQTEYSLRAAQNSAAQLSGEINLYRVGMIVLAVAVIGLLALSAYFAGKARPVVVPVTVSDVPVSRTTIDNDEDVPGATVVLSREMRQHIDRLIANVG